MKNKTFLSILTCLLLASCAPVSSSSETSNVTSNITSDATSNITSTPSTSETPSSSSSSVSSSSSEVPSSSSSSASSSTSEEVVHHYTVKEMKELALKELKDKKSPEGIARSDIKASLNLQLISIHDLIAGGSKYTSRHKALMCDETGYIYVTINNVDKYKQMDKYSKNHQTYKVEGTLGMYLDEVEINSTTDPVYLAPDQYKDEILDVDFNTLVEDKVYTLKEYYDEILTISLNNKGSAMGKLVKLEVKALALNDIQSNNLYVGADNYILNVHGNDSLHSHFVEGSSYTLIGAFNMHNYRPGIEYALSNKLTKDIPFDSSSALELTTEEFYKYKYETEVSYSQLSYSKFFMHPLKVKGYSNYYTKSSNGSYAVLTSKYDSKDLGNMNVAISKKALMFMNKSCEGLYESNQKYCMFNDYFLQDTLLEVTVFPYMWNTAKYFQAFAYELVISK